jgi:hypothetical protein
MCGRYESHLVLESSKKGTVDCMVLQTVRLGRQQFVLVAKRDFDRIAAQAQRQQQQDRQDAGDIAEVRRRKARGESKPYTTLRKKLGLR